MSKLCGTLGIDTSNYTCSAAFFDCTTFEITQSKLPLPVKSGERGVRQSDAVFHHTMLLPQVLEALGELCRSAQAVGVSDRPSCREGSYMPCFMTGLGAARAISAASGMPYFTTTHQVGHILAALYSADKLSLLQSSEPFLAFHISGGTTDMLLCQPQEQDILQIKRIGGSSDLKAGQLIDRCGVMLGIDFPCGRELERLSDLCGENIKVRPSVKGLECSLSGVQNKCEQLYKSGAEACYVAAFCIRSVESALLAITREAVKSYGSLPIICAGGVMSNRTITAAMKESFGAYFAKPEFSADNAAGAAVYAAIRKGLIKRCHL